MQDSKEKKGNKIKEKVLNAVSQQKQSNKSTTRSNYTEHPAKFVEWVNGLGIEKTWFGKFIYELDKKFNLKMLTYLFGFSIVLSFLIHFEADFSYTGYTEGEIAKVDLKSPIPFELLDEEATAHKRVEAENAILPIYDYDPDIYDSLLDRIESSFKAMRVQLRGKRWSKNEFQRDQELVKFLEHKQEFVNNLGLKIRDSQFKWLAVNKFSYRHVNIIVQLLEPITYKKIVNDLSELQSSGNEKVVMRMVDADGAGNEIPLEVSSLADVNDIKRKIKTNPLKSYKINSKERRNIVRLVQAMIVPNMRINLQETSERKQNARDSVLPIKISMKKNQVIISEGAPITKKHIYMLNHIKNLKDKKQSDLISLMSAILFVGLIIVFFSYLKRFSISKIQVNHKDLIAMGTVTLSLVLITKIFLFLTDSAPLLEMGIELPVDTFMYFTPFAAGAMMVGLLMTSGEVVWLFTLFYSLVIGLMLNFNFSAMLVTLVGGVAGARGVFGCKKRNDIYRAGLRTGLVNIFVISCITLITVKDSIGWHMLWYIIAGFASGVISSLIAMMLIPWLESMFSYTTDLRLLELSNLNHPLLRDLLLKAPGTYHHSIIVGTMAESAAEQIGANALLSKVGAFYHDIGKAAHAEYFIENQRKGHNPHDQISPHMSKTILIAHVKDGVELGAKHKLGKPIIDIIQQHHGTTLISYFYNKAKEAEDDIHQVSEEEFRYPGPKPQFREAGIVMLADSIEAAARSLDEPTPVRLQNIVKNIIQNKFLDGQLDECNLTLKDLSVIEGVFKRILLTLYHQRIDYPASHGGINNDALKALEGGKDKNG